ncbi:MAG: GNAT family N-acetyltransferase [Bacteroidota bacterium]
MIKFLEWDSNFFGYKVAKIDLINRLEDIEKEIEWAKDQDIKLIYLFLDSDLPGALSYLSTNNFEVIDEKIIFSKSIVKEIPSSDLDYHFVTEVNFKKRKEGFYELAYISGEHSRFKNDPLIPEKKFREMYRMWVKNSVIKNDSELINISDKGKLVGMITVDAKEDHSSIGLLAVKGTARGRGIGRILIGLAEQFSRQKDLSELRVATQKLNTNACKFYEQMNFKVFQGKLISHIWL